MALASIRKACVVLGVRDGERWRGADRNRASHVLATENAVLDDSEPDRDGDRRILGQSAKLRGIAESGDLGSAYFVGVQIDGAILGTGSAIPVTVH